MIIGLAQMDISWEDIERNMKKAQEFIEKAVENNVELILFPEMALTGFTMNIDKLLLKEEEIIDWIKKIAVESKINIGLGFAIRVDERGKNKYIVISKEGKILLKYTKLHPFSYAGESEKYYQGEEIDTCKIDEFNIASFICYDLRFPEIFQIASKKAQIITVAANWPESRQEHWITLLKARAIENQCYVIGINRVGIGDGLQYDGGSVFINPNGEILNELTSKEALVVETLEIEQVSEVRAKFDIKRDRRENFYNENRNYFAK
ncbi:carbon-nitrogen family hydrolase [uncultured Clostridium sp.]|uniref:carbon-nitrogen family hydrolase n=1 Tax=uncultured Clostridium sp. TaxID=59620 RepID=UPI0028EE5B7B|nr:carbon-nitrogen family hydrolase [uncultured Clostridium sp.]